jgi:cytoskeletal protein CcmA (bactofilin family)
MPKFSNFDDICKEYNFKNKNSCTNYRCKKIHKPKKYFECKDIDCSKCHKFEEGVGNGKTFWDYQQMYLGELDNNRYSRPRPRPRPRQDNLSMYEDGLFCNVCVMKKKKKKNGCFETLSTNEIKSKKRNDTIDVKANLDVDGYVEADKLYVSCLNSKNKKDPINVERQLNVKGPIVNPDAKQPVHIDDDVCISEDHELRVNKITSKDSTLPIEIDSDVTITGVIRNGTRDNNCPNASPEVDNTSAVVVDDDLAVNGDVCIDGILIVDTVQGKGEGSCYESAVLVNDNVEIEGNVCINECLETKCLVLKKKDFDYNDSTETLFDGYVCSLLVVNGSKTDDNINITTDISKLEDGHVLTIINKVEAMNNNNTVTLVDSSDTNNNVTNIGVSNGSAVMYVL